MSTLPQPQVNFFVETDKNGVTWLFPKQEFVNSCGPACLRYVKSLFYDCRFTEGEARQQISQFELRRPVGGTEKSAAYGAALSKATDQSSIKSVKQALKMVLAFPDPSNAHMVRASGPWIGASSWQGMGTRPELVVKALQSDPMPVSSARLVTGDYLSHLTKTTDKYPAIVAVIWMRKYTGAKATAEDKKLAREQKEGTGGHFILCSGLTREGSQFIILDPMNGRKIHRS